MAGSAPAGSRAGLLRKARLAVREAGLDDVRLRFSVLQGVEILHLMSRQGNLVFVPNSKNAALHKVEPALVEKFAEVAIQLGAEVLGLPPNSVAASPETAPVPSEKTATSLLREIDEMPDDEPDRNDAPDGYDGPP